MRKCVIDVMEENWSKVKVVSSSVQVRLRGLSVSILPFQSKLNYAPWPESASELYRPRRHRLSAKIVPTFAHTGCHVVSVTDP
jgi:hypothetical protein